MNKFAIVFVTGADAVQGWFSFFNPLFERSAPAAPLTEKGINQQIQRADQSLGGAQGEKARAQKLENMFTKADTKFKRLDELTGRVSKAIDATDYTTNPKDVDALLLEAQLACLPPAPKHRPTFDDHNQPGLSKAKWTTRRGHNKTLAPKPLVSYPVVPEPMALADDVTYVTKNLLPPVEAKAVTVREAYEYMTGNDKTTLDVLDQNIKTVKTVMIVGVSSKDFDRNKLGLLIIDAKLNELATNQMHAVKPLFLVKPQEGKFKTKWEEWKGKVVEAGKQREGTEPDLKTFQAFVVLAELSHDLANIYIKQMEDSVFIRLGKVELNDNFDDFQSGLGDWRRTKYTPMTEPNESKTVFDIAKGLESMYSTAEFFFLDQKFQTLLTKSKGQPNEAIIKEKRWYNIAAKNWRALETRPDIPVQTNVEQKYDYYKKKVATFEVQAGIKVTLPAEVPSCEPKTFLQKYFIDFSDERACA